MQPCHFYTHMTGILYTSDVYAPAEDTNIQKCAEIVPDQMYDFIEWCLNDKVYNKLTSCSEDDVPKINLKQLPYVII